jgi:hypothetical protein
VRVRLLVLRRGSGCANAIRLEIGTVSNEAVRARRADVATRATRRPLANSLRRRPTSSRSTDRVRQEQEPRSWPLSHQLRTLKGVKTPIRRSSVDSAVSGGLLRPRGGVFLADDCFHCVAAAEEASSPARQLGPLSVARSSIRKVGDQPSPRQTTKRGHKTDTSETTRATSTHLSALKQRGLQDNPMVRRGSTVRVRQRASGFFLLSWSFRCPSGRRLRF